MTMNKPETTEPVPTELDTTRTGTNDGDTTETTANKDQDVQNDKTKISQLKCFVNLLKGNIGTGILALPMAFRNAGIWVGVVGNLFLGYVALHCMHMLIDCSDTVRKRTNSGPLGYAEVAETCVATGPKCIRKYKKTATVLVNVYLFVIQLGACCVYIVFIADNLTQVINSSDAPDPALEKILIVCEAVMMILFCTLVQSLKGLAYLSMLANVLQISGLVIVMYYISTDLPNIETRRAVGPIDTLPLYFGVAVYALEGIGLVMPFKNKVRDEYDYGRKFGLLTLAITVVIVLYIAVGFFGYLKYGDHVFGSITLNVPATGWLGKTTKMMFVVAIFISYGLMFYVPMTIIWPAVEVHLKTDAVKCLVNIVIRVGLVIFTCIIAISVPDLGLLISLGGALTCTTLQYIFPPLIHIITFSAEGETLHGITIIKDVLIILMGLTGMCLGTYTCIVAIIHTV